MAYKLNGTLGPLGIGLAGLTPHGTGVEGYRCQDDSFYYVLSNGQDVIRVRLTPEALILMVGIAHELTIGENKVEPELFVNKPEE